MPSTFYGLLTSRKFYYHGGGLEQIQSCALFVCVLCIIYWLTIGLIKKWYMIDRLPFQLWSVYRVWAAVIGLCSVAACVRLMPEFSWAVKKLGFVGSFCESGGYFDGSSGYWAWLCAYFNLAEMCSSVLMVLQKRRVTKLHRFYHTMATLYHFLVYPENFAFFRWALMSKLVIHAAMYWHSFMTASGYRVSRNIERLLAIAQLLRFVFCQVLLLAIASIKLSPVEKCDSSTWPVIIGSLLMYFVTTLYYWRYFRRTHIDEVRKRRVDDKRQAVQSKSYVNHRRESKWILGDLEPLVDMVG